MDADVHCLQNRAEKRRAAVTAGQLCQHISRQLQALSVYATKVLDAFGFRFGGLHCEIIWTANGPVLVEANARLMSASIYTPALVAALGCTQA